MEREKNSDANDSESAVPESDPQFGRGFLRETLIPILAVIAIVIPLRSAIADWNDVPSGSMRPTILEGDRIWVNKLAYGLRLPLTMRWIAQWDAPARGDVVTFVSPDDGIRLVKRIVGIPGDRISMQNNKLVLNGTPLDYVDSSEIILPEHPNNKDIPAFVMTENLHTHPHSVTVIPALSGHADSFSEFTVPDGHYFFLGDNRDQSRDSRFIGTVALENIYGRVTHVALSVDPKRYFRPRFERWFMPLDQGV